MLKNHYQSVPIPINLSFDEESLFWRLRLGEGIPVRNWHKPFDRKKNWHEIKVNLDKKIESSRVCAVFHQIYPLGKFWKIWLIKIIQTLKSLLDLK